MTTPAGWYPAPEDSQQLRYWDGSSWTIHFLPNPDVAPAPPESLADLPPPPPDDPLPHQPDLADLPPPVATEQKRSRPTRPPVLWLVALLVIVVGGVFVATSVLGGNDDPETTTGASVTAGDNDEQSGPDDVAQDDSSTGADPGSARAETAITTTTTTTTASPTTTTSTTTTPTTLTPSTIAGPIERPVTLLVDVAKLRVRPNLDAAEVDTITDLAGATIVAVGDPIDGWYEVRIGFQQGWMFGAFILPPAPGLTVLQTQSETPATLRNTFGQELGIDNASGSYVLATSLSGPLLPVILPEGGTAFVNASEMKIRS